MSSTSIISISKLGFPWETQDPFLFCAHHFDQYPKGNAEMGPAESLAGRNLGNDFTVKDGYRMYHGQRIPGFPAHPHRGFETVTIVRTGMADHSDSLGAAGRFGDGDVQWMTAGKGVQHAEMFPLLKEDQPNPFELFQIWLNLPSYKKFVDPHYAMLWAEEIPKITMKDEVGKTAELDLIAGGYGAKKAPKPAPDSWAADPKNAVEIWTLSMEAGATFTIPKSQKDTNRNLYFHSGSSISIDGKDIKSYHRIELAAAEDVLIRNGDEKAHFLFLQGKPIDEPVAQYGPFVMNTNQEIQETIRDYQRTQFGGWPWPSTDPVHAREKGRFALHADGRLEEKS